MSSSSNYRNDDTNNLNSSGYSRRTTDDRRELPNRPRARQHYNQKQQQQQHYDQQQQQHHHHHHRDRGRERINHESKYPKEPSSKLPRIPTEPRGSRIPNEPRGSRIPNEPRGSRIPDEPRGMKRTHEKESYRPSNKLSPQNELQKLQSKLSEFSNIESIDQIKVIDSRWDVKPKGFEEVGAARAKLSGLFPLPGYPRPVDFTKLEGLIKNRMLDSNDVLHDVSKIEPIDSRLARLLIIEVDFKIINYLKIVEFFNDYLKMIDYDNTNNNIHSKRKLDNKLIIEFNNAESATIIYSLNGTELLLNAYKEDDAIAEGKFKLKITRPNEYVVSEEDSKKVSIVTNATQDELQQLGEIQYLRQKGTKEPLGLVFAKSDKIQEIKALPFVNDAFYSCQGKYIQQTPITYTKLKNLVNNDPKHEKSKVIQILNAVTIKDLIDDEMYQFILKDMKHVIGLIGKIISIKIPRPANDYTPGLSQFNQPGLGKIFIEFDDEESALKAIMELSGRSYNDRTVLCSYFDQQDFKNDIL
ncbi:unnamed protein product [Candida verbasci]|uniref:RRM domain-containing protein n=1 Tax=Candida verbasci TaxID=1227364 RepID=A0A9W4TTL9_9ASCO|nr:unnamed protein product [Candida verbasci]